VCAYNLLSLYIISLHSLHRFYIQNHINLAYQKQQMCIALFSFYSFYVVTAISLILTLNICDIIRGVVRYWTRVYVCICQTNSIRLSNLTEMNLIEHPIRIDYFPTCICAFSSSSQYQLDLSLKVAFCF
jgi:hypothetical protein